MHSRWVSSIPIVLFGAFDRHNLGDLLLGQAAALAAAPRPCLFAGLRAADLRPLGGFEVEALPDVLAGWRKRFGAVPPDLVHVGGEILDTDAWEAAVMLLPASEAHEVVARLERDPTGRAAWVAAFLGTERLAPYAVGRDEVRSWGLLEFRAVGGVGLEGRDAGFAGAIVHALESASRLTVRDHRTQGALARLGVPADLAPDPVTGLAPWLRREIAALPPLGGSYVALQCAATFGDDAALDALASLLNGLGWPAVLFRAGAAPWHDELPVLARLLRRLRVPARVLDSLHVRDICAAIGGARFCLASSLHVLLVAGIFRVPALGLEGRPGEGVKLRAYAETWGGFQVATPQALASCPGFYEEYPGRAGREGA